MNKHNVKQKMLRVSHRQFYLQYGSLKRAFLTLEDELKVLPLSQGLQVVIASGPSIAASVAQARLAVAVTLCKRDMRAASSTRTKGSALATFFRRCEAIQSQAGQVS